MIGQNSTSPQIPIMTRIPEPMEDKALTWPWRRLLHYDSIESTQTLAAQMMRMGRNLKGAVIWAERQKRGRGRLDHTWASDTGGLYLTACLPYEIAVPPTEIGWVTLIAALSCVEVLREQLELTAMIKWPNDVLIMDRKVAGVLGELKAPGQEEEGGTVLIGFGLNWMNRIRAVAEAEGFSAASLAEFREDLSMTGRRAYLNAWLARLYQWHNELVDDLGQGIRKLTEAVEAVLWHKGETVRLKATEKGDLEGILLGIGTGGAARLRLADGSEPNVQCGQQG